jgi:hypothetical protein
MISVQNPLHQTKDIMIPFQRHLISSPRRRPFLLQGGRDRGKGGDSEFASATAGIAVDVVDVGRFFIPGEKGGSRDRKIKF